MKEVLKNYKSNLPIILLIAYTLGFVYLNRYFSRFDIAIEYYISLTDILFFTIKSLIQLAITFLIVEVVLWIIAIIVLEIWKRVTRKKKQSEISDKDEMEDFPSRTYRIITTVILFVLVCVLFFITSEYLIVASTALPYLIVKMYSLLKDQEINNKIIGKSGENFSRSDKLLFFLTILTMALIFSFAVSGYKDGNCAKTKDYNSVPVEFTQDTTLYSTSNGTYNFIGETSSCIFLYNRKDLKTYVFNRQNISNLKILDPAIKEVADWEDAQKKVEGWHKNATRPIRKDTSDLRNH